VSADVPPPLGGPSAIGGVSRGQLKNQKIRVVPFVNGTAISSVILSSAKCGWICRGRDLRTLDVVPSRLAKGFLQGGPKSSKILMKF